MKHFLEDFIHNPSPIVKPETPPHPPKPDVPSPPDSPLKPPHFPQKQIGVIINGIDKQLENGTEFLSYEDVIRLAFGTYSESSNIIYTVVYSKGPKNNPKGTLVKGQFAKVREGMIFNVSRSDKS